MGSAATLSAHPQPRSVAVQAQLACNAILAAAVVNPTLAGHRTVAVARLSGSAVVHTQRFNFHQARTSGVGCVELDAAAQQTTNQQKTPSEGNKGSMTEQPNAAACFGRAVLECGNVVLNFFKIK